MTTRWTERFLLRGEFGLGFFLGVIVVALPIALVLYVRILPQMQDIATTMDRTDELSQQNFEAAMARWEKCQTGEDERNSAATLLYEFEPGEGIDLLGGLFEIRPGSAIAGPGKIAPYGRQVVRWYIPIKVKPEVYDDARGRAYSWYIRKGKRIEGPFVPEGGR